MKATTRSAVKAMVKEFPSLHHFLKEESYGDAEILTDPAPAEFFFVKKDDDSPEVKCFFFDQKHNLVGKLGRVVKNSEPFIWYKRSTLTRETFFPETVMQSLERLSDVSYAIYKVDNSDPLFPERELNIFFAPKGYNLLDWSKKVIKEADDIEELKLEKELAEMRNIS